MDTIPGHLRSMNDGITQSTISRFACRILVDRNPPYTARIYAAGFDSGRNIFLGVHIYDLDDSMFWYVYGALKFHFQYTGRQTVSQITSYWYM